MSEEVRKNTVIAVDAMGSDLGPGEMLAGIHLALRNNWIPEKVIVVGKVSVLEPLLEKEGLAGDPKVELFGASEVIEMGEKPIQSIRRKPDASLVRAVDLVKLGTSAAAVSCGNTGSLMACGTLKLRPIEGVSKPALASVWPSRKGRFVVLDVGANPQCRPENLFHYALLGHQYAMDALGEQSPRVGLLSIGTEEGKGTDLTSGAHALLKKLEGQINYVGLIEGFQLFNDAVDVVVTDGFTGNVLLKSCESLWGMVKEMVKEEVNGHPFRMAGALLMKPALRDARTRMDPKQFGGAPLLGLRGTVLKAHGSSDREAVASAIRIAATAVRHNLGSHSLEAVRIANETIGTTPASESVSVDES